VSDKTLIAIMTSVIFTIAVLISAGIHFVQRDRGGQREMTPPAFGAESGPYKVGSYRFWVIRHTDTGQRFVLVENGGSVALQPLK